MIWLDAHLSPRLAVWIREGLGYDAVAIRDLGLRDAEDTEIFSRGREAQAIILTKDRDFAEMVVRQGTPPVVIWLRCGNASEVYLKGIVSVHLADALQFLEAGEELIEIRISSQQVAAADRHQPDNFQPTTILLRRRQGSAFGWPRRRTQS